MSKVCKRQQKGAKEFPAIQSTSTNITHHISQRIHRLRHLNMHDANFFSIPPQFVSRSNFVSTIGFSILFIFLLTALVSDDISISDMSSINTTHILSQPISVLIPTARRALQPHRSYRHTLARCDILCSYCHALHWIQEHSYKSTISSPLFFTCCQRGQISLTSFPDAPQPLNSLLQDNTLGN